jgi:hypothetical protein
MDTATRRYSAINVGSPWRGVLPLPDGSVDAADRPVVAFLYALEAAEAQPERRGGAFYPTPAEMREYLRSRRKLERERREIDEARDFELRELYDDLLNPQRIVDRRLKLLEMDDEEAILHMLIAIEKDLH